MLRNRSIVFGKPFISRLVYSLMENSFSLKRICKFSTKLFVLFFIFKPLSNLFFVQMFSRSYKRIYIISLFCVGEYIRSRWIFTRTFLNLISHFDFSFDFRRDPGFVIQVYGQIMWSILLLYGKSFMLLSVSNCRNLSHLAES